MEGQKGCSFCSLECKTREWIRLNLGFERWDQALTLDLQGVVAGVWGGSDHGLDCFFPKDRAPGQLVRDAAEPTRHRRGLAKNKSHGLPSRIPVQTSCPLQGSSCLPLRRLREGARRGAACQAGTHKPPQIPAKTWGQDVTPRLPGAGFTVE